MLRWNTRCDSWPVHTFRMSAITEFMYKGEGSPGEFVEFTNLRHHMPWT